MVTGFYCNLKMCLSTGTYLSGNKLSDIIPFSEGDVEMTISKPIFWDYATFDNDGNLSGVKDDAPDEVKRDYQKFKKKEEKLKKRGIKI